MELVLVIEFANTKHFNLNISKRQESGCYNYIRTIKRGVSCSA